MADNDREEHRVTFTFGHRERSPGRRWDRRGRGLRRYDFPGPYVDISDSSSSESDESSCSDGGYGFAGLLTHRRRHRHHRQHHRHPDAVVVNNGHVALGLATNRLGRPAAAPAQLRNYGYRRLHVQGGQERERRRTRRAHHDRCHVHQRQHHQQQGQERQCILTRCCRWIFGGLSERCTCEDERGVLCCRRSRSRSRSTSPMRHREEEYWGPGTHVCPIAGSAPL